jgi:YD repeat-containing protein
MTVVASWAARLLIGVSLVALSAPAMPSETVSYSYDARGRLVKVVHSGTVNDGVSADYSYDKADNRTNVTVTAGGPPIPAFAINDVTATEGSSIAFQISRNGATSDTLTVDLATADGTAIAGSDYTAVASTLTFLPTDTSKTVNVATSNNATVNGTRAFYANLTNASAGSAISDSQGVGIINDDEVAVIPSFKINDASANEGSSVTFTVTKTGLTDLSYNVHYATQNGSASSSSDYTAQSGTVTFGPTETQKTVTIATTGDTSPEDNETFTVNLSSASGGATISDAQGTGTITNNDGVGISISNAVGFENDILTFTVTKVGSTSSTITVKWATAYSTATANDFTAGSGTLSFAPSTTSLSINIPTQRQLISEPDEVFFVNLTKGTGTYNITDAQGVGTIHDGAGSCGGSQPSC